MTTLIGYARVSTDDQNAELQVDALKKAGCLKVFTDKASGSLANRPLLDRMLDQLRPEDVVVVWRLDRLGRSRKNLIALVEVLAEKGVGLRNLPESIDTSTANGKFFFSVIGALGEFERDLIRERTLAGLAAARARGRVGGRPPVTTPEKVKVAQPMYASREHTVEAIAKTLGVSRTTVYRHLAPAGLSTPLSERSFVRPTAWPAAHSVGPQTSAEPPPVRGWPAQAVEGLRGPSLLARRTSLSPSRICPARGTDLRHCSWSAVL